MAVEAAVEEEAQLAHLVAQLVAVADERAFLTASVLGCAQVRRLDAARRALDQVVEAELQQVVREALRHEPAVGALGEERRVQARDLFLRAAPQRDLGVEHLLLEHTRRQAVLDVVHVIRGRVGEVDDLRLEPRLARPRQQLRRPVTVGLVLQERLARLARQVEARVVGAAALEPIDDAQHLRVVAKTAVCAHLLVQRFFAAVAERRVADVVREREHFRQRLVQTEPARDAARDLVHLERVAEACALVIPAAVDEDLRLVHQAPERRRVHDAVAVALPTRAERVVGLRELPSARRGALLRPRGEVAVLAPLLRCSIDDAVLRHVSPDLARSAR